MSKKPSQYEQINRDLQNKMLAASSLKTEMEKQSFVAQTFVAIHDHYKAKHVTLEEYVKLINKLGTSYAGGSFNDYVDTLAGAAQLNMLDTIIAQSQRGNVAQESRQRRDAVTGLTGVEPIKPEEGE